MDIFYGGQLQAMVAWILLNKHIVKNTPSTFTTTGKKSWIKLFSVSIVLWQKHKYIGRALIAGQYKQEYYIGWFFDLDWVICYHGIQ